jgi:hypothetical protein
MSADFNNDGNLDLVTGNAAAATISMLLGNGDGTFAEKEDFPVGAAPQSLVTGHFNPGAKLDLATANQDDGTVSILLNTSQ